MQLTIDVKDSAIDKIMYLLKNLKEDVTIIEQGRSTALDIQPLSPSDEDYKIIIDGRKERKNHPENYTALEDIKWD